jgi:hypothetical protein
MADGSGGHAFPKVEAAAGAAPGGPPQPGSPQAIAADWVTIWQSELAALATDREMQDAWTRLVARWAQLAQAAVRLLPQGVAGSADGSAGRAGPAAPARPKAPVAAPDARDAALQHLADRVEELERRLRALSPGDPAA